MANNTEDVELDEILTRAENMVEGFTIRRLRGNTRDMVSPKSIHAEAMHDIKLLIQQEANRQKAELLDRMTEPTLEDVGLMQPEQYEGGVIINDYWKTKIEAERAKLKEVK